MTETKDPAEKPLRMTSIPFILMITEAVIESVGNKLKLVTTLPSICTCVVVSAVVSKSTEMTWHCRDRTSKVETPNFGTDIRIVAYQWKEVFHILRSWPCFWNCIMLTLGLGRLICTNHPYCLACYSIACVPMLNVKYWYQA